jgi:hypothetical protein
MLHNTSGDVLGDRGRHQHKRLAAGIRALEIEREVAVDLLAAAVQQYPMLVS